MVGGLELRRWLVELMPNYASALALLSVAGLAQVGVGWYFRDHSEPAYRRDSRRAIYAGLASLLLATIFAAALPLVGAN